MSILGSKTGELLNAQAAKGLVATGTVVLGVKSHRDVESRPEYRSKDNDVEDVR